MPIINNQKLILADARQIQFTDKRTGALVSKWKYTFLTPEGKLKRGFDDNGFYKDEVKVCTGWDESLAKDYPWELTEFQGETTEHLFAGRVPKIGKK